MVKNDEAPVLVTNQMKYKWFDALKLQLKDWLLAQGYLDSKLQEQVVLQMIHTLFADIENVYFVMKNGIDDPSTDLDETDTEYQRLLTDCGGNDLEMYTA